MVDAQKKIADKEASSGSHHIGEIADLYSDHRFVDSRADPESQDPIEQMIMLQAQYAEDHAQPRIKIPGGVPLSTARYIDRVNKPRQNLTYFLE